jgi:DNA-binding CsgD family transcriptional regulator
VGELIFRYEGTLERFAGDGVMVFFNDPIPCPDPPARAVQMAVTMRERVGELTRGWRKRGHELGFGVGISVGFATLGKIGFQGRFDYAAIGNVTNLAARLCEEAQDGQILISQRVYAAVETLVEAEPVGEVSLKGFRLPVAAFNVIRLRTTVPPLDAGEASSAAALTPLEQKLAVLIARGMADARIAEHLGISEKTATDHVDGIIRKLGLTGRPQVARWVVEQGVLQKPS